MMGWRLKFLGSLILILIIILILPGCITRNSISMVPGPMDLDRKKTPVFGKYIRIAVEKDVKKINIVSKNAFFTYNGTTHSLPSASTLEIINKGYVLINGRSFPAPVAVHSEENLILNGKEYYGEIIIRDFLVINVLPLEEYLKGVLSSEVAENWPFEALKAQAIVSRTYALNRMLYSTNSPYDLEDSEIHQKFQYRRNNSRINEAIEATEGTIILYRDKPIQALYHASSGGRTENSGDIFQEDLPYLRSTPDPYSPKNQWTFRATTHNLMSALKDLIDSGSENLKLKDVRIYRRTGSGRVDEILLIFEGNYRQIIRGNTFRLAVGSKDLKSLFIHEIKKELSEREISYIFSGRGYGHGVGLSQQSAKKMAEIGFSYRDIIAYFYRGTYLENYQVLSQPSHSSRS